MHPSSCSKTHRQFSTMAFHDYTILGLFPDVLGSQSLQSHKSDVRLIGCCLFSLESARFSTISYHRIFHYSLSFPEIAGPHEIHLSRIKRVGKNSHRIREIPFSPDHPICIDPLIVFTVPVGTLVLVGLFHRGGMIVVISGDVFGPKVMTKHGETVPLLYRKSRKEL